LVVGIRIFIDGPITTATGVLPNNEAIAGLKSGPKGVVRVATDASSAPLGLALGRLVRLDNLQLTMVDDGDTGWLLPTTASGWLLISLRRCPWGRSRRHTR